MNTICLIIGIVCWFILGTLASLKYVKSKQGYINKFDIVIGFIIGGIFGPFTLMFIFLDWLFWNSSNKEKSWFDKFI